MKILVVGGAGYMGGYLIDYLLDKNCKVTVYDSLVYEQRFLKDVPFIRGDIRDREKLTKVLPKFDVVIWLAAIVGDGACAFDPFLTRSINEDSVKWLVDNYERKIIFMSTCSVYGVNKNLLAESAKPKPLSVYAATKLEAEQYIIKNARDFLIFRLGTLFGIGDSFSRVRFDLIVNVLAKRAALGETIIVFGGEQWRPLLHVKNSARAIYYVLDKNITGLYNLAENNYKIKRVAQTIQGIIPNTKIEFQDRKYEDLRDYKVDCSRFFDKGWKPTYSLEDGIMEIYNLIKEGRIKDVNDPVFSNEQYLGKILSRI